MAQKTYQKTHKSASAGAKHMKKIRKRGGKVKVSKLKSGHTLKYSFNK